MGYGMLNGCLGAGAVLGATALPKLRRKVSADLITVSASLVFVCSLAVLGLSHSTPLLVFWLLAAGFAWTSTTSTFNVAVQLSVPGWVQARALGAYQTLFWGGMAFGSSLWGFIAERTSTTKSLVAASMWGSADFALRAALPHAPRNTASSVPINSTARALKWLSSRTPRMARCSRAINATSRKRIMRNSLMPSTNCARGAHASGAIRWGVYRDTAAPDRIVENFVVESWLEFLRERERMTKSDRAILDRVRSFHQGEGLPVASFMIYAREAGE